MNVLDFNYHTDPEVGKNAPYSPGTWENVQTLKTCNLSSQERKMCQGTIPGTIDLDYDPWYAPRAVGNNTLGIRVTFVNQSNAQVYLDTAGMAGW